MASLKEIKNRINSVGSTRKITSAMKMIASSKLHKAQGVITSFLPYQRKLDSILINLLSSDTDYTSLFVQQREVKKVAIVAFSSNSSLCGAFNANIVKEFWTEYDKYESLGKDNVLIYPVGKKIADALKKKGYKVEGNYDGLLDHSSFVDVQNLAKDLIAKFMEGQLDEVVLIYHHFVSMGSQKMTRAVYLPFALSSAPSMQIGKQKKHQEVAEQPPVAADYILEPSKKEILETLIPTVLYARLFAALLDSSASEHAARTIAMQVATDNAEDLNRDLKILFNKTRQQAVTNELLDIIGGASALQ